MSRIARNQMNTTFFHNMMQGINKEYIFEEKKCKKKYMDLLQENANEYGIKLIAFTIMDNHAHVLLYAENIHNMSLFMKNVNGKFAMYYNFIYERVGIVFRNRYKSQPIYSEEQFKNCIRYIFNNPVRARIVLSPEKYVYSNFKDFQISQLYNSIFSTKYKEDPPVYKPDSTENVMAKNDFIDTSEDKEMFIRELIKNYEEEHNITSCMNKKYIKNMVKYIKQETNISNVLLAEILQLSKSTIAQYVKS